MTSTLEQKPHYSCLFEDLFVKRKESAEKWALQSLHRLTYYSNN